MLYKYLLPKNNLLSQLGVVETVCISYLYYALEAAAKAYAKKRENLPTGN